MHIEPACQRRGFRGWLAPLPSLRAAWHENCSGPVLLVIGVSNGQVKTEPWHCWKAKILSQFKQRLADARQAVMPAVAAYFVLVLEMNALPGVHPPHEGVWPLLRSPDYANVRSP